MDGEPTGLGIPCDEHRDEVRVQPGVVRAVLPGSMDTQQRGQS